MQVIDIPSSPEPSGSPMTRRTRSVSRQPGPSKKRRRVAAPAREPSIIELIELTDSDNDPSSTHAKTSDPMPLFGKPNFKILAGRRTPVPGPSRHVERRERQDDGVPLFLPSGDEERVIRPLQAPAAQDAAAPAHPQPLHPKPVAPHAPVVVDPIDEYIIRVLEIVPDVQPTHALALITQFMQSQPGNVVEFVLHALFEDASYPKVDKKGKHKRDEPDGDPSARGSPKPKVDYTSKERAYNCGPYYFERSLEQLMMDFPRIPKPHIRSRLLDNRFYAPTYLLLAEELKKEHPPFRLKTTNSAVGKGKERQDPEFDREREWVLLKVAELATERDAALAASVNEQEYEENGEGIECGCCFSGYPFDQMIQCPEAHLFCKSCMIAYASNLLGEHNPNIVCMDQSGCKLPFPESELCRLLSSKLLELYYRVKQRKEIEAAGLKDLEECPYCEYKCVIENEMEKLFRCENASCSAITCRACKKPDHLPKSCEEVTEDKRLDAQHVIEEAMTQALMRNCPKCQKSFIKEMGCNKMTCPNCHTVSCYVCRKIIVGYNHFSNSAHQSGKVDKSKCNLWDPVEQRHAEEVSEAAKRALAELRKSRPDVDEAQLKVDMPVVPAPQTPRAPGHGVALALNGAPPLLRMGAPLMGGPGVIGRGRDVAAGMDMGMGAGAMGMGMGIPLMGGPGAIGRGRDVAAGIGIGIGMGAGIGVGARDPFTFGVGQAHAFAPPAVLGAPPPRLGFGLGPPPAQAAAAMMPVQVEQPALPLAQARGRRRPVPSAPVKAEPVMAAGGGGGRRRRGR